MPVMRSVFYVPSNNDKMVGNRITSYNVCYTKLLRFGDTFLAQYFVYVPGNRLTLAVKVCRQVDGLGLAGGPDDLADMLFAALVQLVGHREIVVRIDPYNFV